MYKAVDKNKATHHYMEALAIYTGAKKVHWEDSISCIYVVEYKRVTTRVKHIDIPVCFIQEQFDKGIHIKEYDKSSVISADMCTKPWSGTIISRSTIYMTGFILYITSEKEHYQLMILHDFVVNEINCRECISSLCDLALLVSHSAYLRFPAKNWLTCSKMSLIWQKCHRYCINTFIN